MSGFARRALVAIVLAVGVVALVLLLWRLADVVLLGFAGILVAVLLRSGADLVHEYLHLPMGLSLALVGLVLVGGLGVGLYFLLPPFLEQSRQFLATLPTLVSSLEGRLEQIPLLRGYFQQDPTPLSDLLGRTSGVLTGLSSTLFTTLNALGNVLLVVITGFFFAVEPRLYRTDLYRLVPPKVRPRAVEIMYKLGTTLRNWLSGQLLAMTLVAVFTYVGLLLVGLPYAFALAVAAGLLDFIPFLGPVLGAAPALLLAFTDGGTSQAVWVLVVYVVIQQLEGNLFQPIIQKQAVAIPPAVLLLALVAFGTLFGFLGLLVATPITAVLIVLVKELYVYRLERDEQPTS